LTVGPLISLVYNKSSRPASEGGTFKDPARLTGYII
jgi:hypothetical protein